MLWGDQPARLPGWLDGVVRVRYRVAHIFAPELLSETGRTEGLEGVRQLVESTRNLRLPLLDELLGHLIRIKVVRLAALLASELELPWAALAQQHSRRLGGGRRWISPRPHERRLHRHLPRLPAIPSGHPWQPFSPPSPTAPALPVTGDDAFSRASGHRRAG